MSKNVGLLVILLHLCTRIKNNFKGIKCNVIIKHMTFIERPKATQVISIGLGRTMQRKRNSEHLKKTAPEAEVLLK
ncbi:hypothetical protein MTR_3g448970 [Medicago truncatula]|uniref:Transmembrane protein n=1 Tax=Medicago truncatula TaxID=3880 RepID=A0A072V5Z8_MEDTR|nr:hypothetical protein MTR_3g448970 [Medicago truncatula]